jgi:septum formation inhibitor-activating ATPase MinD
MKKHTAVEILEIKLLGIVSFDSEVLRNKYKEQFKIAKRIEQEQIINAYDDASNKICLSCTDFKIGADYYQITFNKEIGKL